MTRVLTVDVGTSAAKAALCVDGRIVDVASAGLAVDAPSPGWAEQSPDDWWLSLAEAITSLPDAHRTGLDAIAVTGQMQDLIAIDGDGDSVRPAILYSDARAADEHAELVDVLGPSWAAAIGAEPDVTNLAAKWRWLAAHEPATVAQTTIVLVGAHSEVARRLTGVVAADPTTAATTGLYDLGAGDWWPPVVEATGIPLAPVRPATEVLGRLRGGPANDLGLEPGAPVVLANGDAVATTLGIVGEDIGRPYAYLGTSGWVAVGTTRRTPAPGAIVLPGLRPDHWITVAPMPTAGATIDWARRELLGGIDHAALDDLAASSCAIAHGVLFVPHLDGTRSPHAAATATGALVGARRSTSRAVIAAAVLEGVAHAVRELIDVVAFDATELVMCGGCSRSTVLRRTVADVTGLPVHGADDDHAALLGAVVAAHLAIGAPRLAMAPTGPSVEPDPHRHAVHRRSAAVFDEALPTMLPLMTSLAELVLDEADGGGNPT